MSRRRKQYDDDDGRVVAKMNVEGMPWYSPPQASLVSNSDDADPNKSAPELNRKETFWIMVGAVKAGLLVAGIFSLALVVIVTICLLIW